MLETIKSYLVSLGFSVDNSSYNEATKAMDNVEKSVAKFAGGAVKQFVTAGAAVTSFVVAANVGIAKFIEHLAKADLENEKLARQLWTSKDAATAYNNTLKAMGVSLQDLYLSPELMRNFQLLREQANGMRAPQEFSDQMKLIRSIMFEFTRMKLEATYALQWIGYYFIKYMGGPITQIKLTLKDINDIIIKTMPSWTKTVAQVMSWFARMGLTTVRAIQDIIRVFNEIGDKIPKNMKLIGGAIAALGLIIETGPLGIIIAIFTAVILLLDDFYTYLDGGESAFGPFWQKLIEFSSKFTSLADTIDAVKKSLQDFFQALADNGTIDNLQKTSQNTFEIIKILIDDAAKAAKNMFSEIDKQGVLLELKQNFLDAAAAFANLTATVTSKLKELLELDQVNQILKSIGDILNNVIVKGIKRLSDYIKTIKDDLNAFSDLFKGDFKGFGKGILNTMGDLFKIKTGVSIPDIYDSITKLYNGKGDGKPAPSAYLYPSTPTQNNSNNKVSMNPTYNIYGSDPQATADAANDNNTNLFRSFRGVIF